MSIEDSFFLFIHAVIFHHFYFCTLKWPINYYFFTPSHKGSWYTLESHTFGSQPFFFSQVLAFKKKTALKKKKDLLSRFGTTVNSLHPLASWDRPGNNNIVRSHGVGIVGKMSSWLGKFTRTPPQVGMFLTLFAELSTSHTHTTWWKKESICPTPYFLANTVLHD